MTPKPTGQPAGLYQGRVNRETISVPESERSNENGMVILSRVNACAPPLFPACSGGVSKKDECADVRRSKTEDEGAVGSKPARPVTSEVTTEARNRASVLAVFCSRNGSAHQSRTVLDLPRRPPAATA